ncbi:TorF family putative porin [Sphingomonas astaxanthinifaciens]|uniref:Outer membrane protein n=1 Tax=Sphingomonas astaxanthinifaciens DSM 22298 TaxID=1123267 RepID=A0ABQ5Z9P7_9SPHN|nr:TorF family putative porin [Sphingomonas astaxanthinifaciens]GLR48726.1 hypothetical protein GCM10007925_24460 [Sphingomonas astaxanthinifaciens DSM 22298]
MRVFDLLTTAAILAAAFPMRASAETAPPFTVTGGTSLVSQYRFRGISLSDEKPAIQGTINLTHASGAYAGAWASSLDGFGELGGSNLELDLYGGYKLPVGKATLDAGVLYYAYPGSKGGTFEFFEPYANVSLPVGPATAKFGAAIAPSQKAIGGKGNVYLFNDNSLPIAGTPVSLTSHVGWSKGDTTLTPGGHYLDWSLGAAASWRNLNASLAWVDTDINRRDALAAGATKTIVDGAVVLSLGASF